MAGSREALEPSRDVDAISEDVVRLNDYVTNVNANAESDALFIDLIACKLLDADLEQRRSSDRRDRARKFCQEAVARVVHDAAAVFRYRGFDSVREERC